MKIRTTFFVFLGILFLSFETSNQDQENFDWLLGKWTRVNDKPGNATFENWSKKSSLEYIGLGCTLAEKDTVFKEHMRLYKNKSQWVFEVVGVNPKPTNFLVTNISTDSFVCENPENDFPKKIKYFKQGKSLIAHISAETQKIEFQFINSTQ